MNMNMDDNNTFQTSDFPLATFLYAKGILLKAILDTPNDRHRKVFLFINPPEDLIKDFQSGNAFISVLAFTNAQQALKVALRERQ